MLDIIFIICLLLLGVYWSSSMKAREIAFMAAATHCRQMDVFLLDDYAALTGQWLRRDAAGRIKVWRSFQFEFSSTGADRYQGKVVMLGREVVSIQMEPYKIQ